MYQTLTKQFIHACRFPFFQLITAPHFMNVFKLLNKRALNAISSTLVLFALLSACGGGGGGGGSSDTPTPTVPSTSLSLAVSNSALTLSEDFSSTLRIATATNATGIIVSQSPRGVVDVTTSGTNVSVSSILNASGRTTLTIVASNSSGSTTAQVVVTVTAVNDPPTLVVSSNSISTVGGFSPITINTTASDIEDANLTFTVAESTTGVVTVTTSTNAIVLNTIADASGRTTLTVSLVDNSGASVTQTIVVNVTVRAGAAPVLMVSNNRISVQEDFGSVAIRTTASDSDSATLTLTVTPSMRLVNVAISTRTNDLSTITLTAIANLNGTATLTFRATDDGGQTNSTEIVVVVAAVNDTPTLTVPTATLTVLEDFDSTNSVATFADLDRGDALTVTVTESSTGIVTVTTSASGVSVSAIAHRNGRTTLNISVSDGLLSSTAQVVVDVTPVNDPPVLTVSTSALTLSEDFGSFLIATTRTDIDSTTLTLTVVESASGIVIVSTSSAGVQLRSTDNISGATTLTITLSDDSTSTSIQVSVIVSAVNDTPTLSVSTTALTLNEDFATTQLITVNRSDIENDTLTLSVAESMSNIVRVSTSSAGVRVAPLLNANGQTTLTITVSDSNTSVSTQVVVTVNAVNDPPTLTVSSSSISTVGGFSPITINTTASDVEDANISFTVINANTRVVTVSTSTNAIVLNSMPGASGQTTLTVRVVDSSGTTVTQSISVSVAITPSAAPVVTVSTNLISVPEDFGTSIIIQTTATDADATNTITVSVSASRPILTAVISTPVNGQSTITNSITLTAIGDANGTTTLTVLASDSGGQSHSTEIVVVVAPVEDAPTINIPSAILTVAEDFSSTQTIATATDADGDTLLISVVQSTTGIVTVTTSVSGASVSSIGNANGQTTLTITINDGNQDTTGQVVVNVTPVNDPPSLNIPSATLTRAEEFAGAITVATASDVEGNPLTFTVTESTTGVIGVTTSSSDVRISSRGEANGITTLVISVSDGDLTTTAQVVVTVTPVNDPPALSVTTTALTLNEDFATVLIGTTRSDIDSNTLTLTVVESATGVVSVTITDAGVQVANITDTNGVTTLTLSLSDGELTTTAQVVVTITPVNDPPSLSASTTALTLNEDFATTEVITVTRSDIDSNTLTLTVSESATGVVTVLTSTSGIFVSSIENINGRTTLTITLSDSLTSVSTQVVVTVNAVNDTPTLTVSTNSITTFNGFLTITINTTASDIEDSTVSFTVSVSTPGVVTVTTSANAITLNAITAATGQTILTVRVVDSSGTIVTQTIAVNVPNRAPFFMVPNNPISLQEDFMTSISLGSAIDLDGNTVTISVSSNTHLVDVAISTQVNSTPTINLSAIENANGTTTLTVQATAAGQSVSTNVVVVVASVNDTPTLSVTTTALTLNEDFATTQLITVNRSDIENDTLTLSVSESMSNIVRVSTSTAGVQVVRLGDANGQTTLTITVSDGQASASTQVLVTVNAVNDPPVLMVSTTALTLVENFATVLIATSRTDADSTSLNFTVVESATGVVTVLTSTSGISVSSINQRSGRTTLTIALSDGNQTITTQVVIVVTAVNDPPVLAVSTTALTLDEDFAAVLIGTTRTDVDSTSLTFTVVESATGVVTVLTSTSGVSVSRIENINGRTTLTITLSDSLTSVSTQVVVTVNAVNDTPTLTVSTNSITTFNGFLTITINTTASDIEDSTVSFTVSVSTPGVVTVTTSANAITLNAITAATGQTILTVRVVDSSGTIVTQTIAVNVPNRAPFFMVPNNPISLQEDFMTSISLGSAIDLDGNTVTISVSSNTHLVDVAISTQVNSTPTINLSAIENANGTTTLTVQATAAGQSVSTNVVVVVASVNDTPTLSVTTTALTLNEDFATTQLITVNRSDIENDTLTLSVSESMSNIVRVSTSTAGVQVVRLGDANGQTTLTITVSDGQASASTQVLVTVNAVNDPPVLMVSTTALTLVENFATVLIATSRTDADSTSLNFTVVESATGVVTVLTSTSGISVSSINQRSGRTTLTIALSDGNQTITTQVVIVVTAVNDPPVLAVSTTALTLDEDFAAVLIGTTRTDVDSTSLTFTVVESATGVVTVLTSTSGVSVSSIEHINGRTTLTITLSDSLTSVSTQVLVTVNAVNDTPTLTVSTNSITTFNGFSTITINTTASDIEDGTLSFTVSASTPGVVTVTTSANAITLNAITAATGQTILTVRVVDSSGTIVTQTIAINVPNRAPFFMVPNNPISLQEDFMTSISLGSAIDLDGNTVTISVSSNTHLVDVAISTQVNSTPTINLSAIENANGTTTLTVQATAAGQSVSTNVVVVVASVNDTPTLSVTTTALTLNEDFATTQLITVNRSDIENDTLTLSVAESMSNIVRVSTSSAGVQVVRIGDANGQTTLTITVSDGQASTSTQVLVTVNAVNDTPTLSVSSNSISTLGGFSPITIYTTATDVEDTNISFTVIDANAGVVKVTTSTNVFMLNNIPGASGRTTLTVRVVDSSGTTVTEIITVNVTITVSATPVVTVSTNLISVAEDFGTSVIIQTTATDGDAADTITVSVSASRPIVTAVISTTVNGQSTVTNSITLTAINNANGTATLTVLASDSGGQSHSTEIVVVVAPVQDAPILNIRAAALSVAEDFGSILTIASASDADGDTLNVSVVQSNLGIVTVTTSASGVSVSSIGNANGQTTLTITVNDGNQDTTGQVVVNVTPVNDTPTLSVSTNRIIVQEDFMGSVVIRTTATDAEGGTITLSVGSPARLVDFALSTPINGKSTLTNSITLTALTNLNGTSTLTVQATDSGGVSTTEQIVVVVNAVDDPIPFSLSTSVVSLSVPGSQLDRIVNAISISNSDNKILRTQVGVTASGDNIFSANPAPVVSFTTNALTTVTTLTSTTPTAQLYFTIAPDQTGTATLTVHLTNLTGTGTLQQTMVVHVNSVNVSPRIAQASPNLANLIVHGGHLYANSVQNVRSLNPLLTEARALGGQLINFNSDEEYQLILGSAAFTHNTWWGLVLPQQNFPGELAWITHDSTIAYGFATGNGLGNLTVYPGQYPVRWNAAGPIANTGGNINGTVYSDSDFLFLLQDVGDGSPRFGLYEFPQGLASSSIITAGSVNTIRLTGFDLNGDTINTANWSGIDSNGGTVNFSNNYQSSGVQTVDMVYTAPSNFDGQTTVVVTLQTNGLSTTTAVSFRVTAAAFTLPTTSIVLIENSSQTIRNQQLISNIRIPSYNGTQNTLDLQWRVTHSGDAIFSTNPTPVVSFSTTDVVTRSNIGSTSQTAQLYFTIAPDKSGTATLTLQLTNLSNTAVGQQTMIVQVNPMNDVPPVIAQASQSLTNLIVQSGRLYANSATSTTQSISPFLTTARALGGHLININTIEEINFVRATTSGLISQNAWLGLVLPRRNFPGELFWITNDSTTAYGYALDSNINNLRLYPGHFTLDWHTVGGLNANRTGKSSTVFNWATYSFSANTYFLIDDIGDGNFRYALYEFPRGLAPANIVSKLVRAGSSVTIGLTGFDLNRDVINTTDWSVVATTGTTSIGHVSQSSGVQTMNLIYTAPEAFNGQTTVVVTLQVNGLMTTNAISFNVDTIPNITLSTYSLVLAEDFSSAVIGTTATDVGVSGVLPFTVIPSSTEIVTISTSANAIQLSAIKNVNGIVTLTIQSTDSSLQTASTQVVVTVRAVNDPPTLSVSSDNVSITGQFISLTINTTASDIEEDNLPVSVTASDINVVNVSIRPNAILLTPRAGGSGRTTLTVTTIDNNNASDMRTIAVNIIVNHSTTPVLTVSTNFISVQEDFADIIIRTTATDADPGTLIVTVRASTPVVNAVVVSTQSITLSAIENVFGTTTLFVSAFDIGGLSDSTEIVVVVAPINDTPTLTVSSQSVVFAYSENATPLVLTVSATDVEDGTLSYSVSTGQGVVNIIMTTNTLTLSRRGFANNVHQVLLTLRTTDTVGVSVTTLVTVVLPPVLIVTTGIKTLNFVWSSISGATHYRLQSNPDLSSGLGFADISTTGIVISPNSTNIRQTTAQGQVSLHRYIPKVNSPFYAVGSCDATSCGATFRHNEEMLTNAQLNSMIGHILPHNPGGDDRFGISVSMSGDGNTLAVGAHLEDSKATGFNGQDDNIRTDSGATYVFRRSNGTWSQQAYLKASNSGLNDYYGEAISLSHDGNTIAIGARLESGSSSGVNGRRNNNRINSGAVYAYAFNNGVWSQQAYIKSIYTGTNDRFGRSVSLSADGNTLAVGAWSEDNLSTGINNYQSSLESINTGGGAGAAYTYVRNGIEWTPQAYIKASNTGNTDRFGYSVSLSDDGKTLAVGAPEENSAATGINGAESDNSADNSGAVYVFRFIGGTWVQEAYVKASNTNAGDRFGESVSLSSDGNTLAVSSNLEDGSSTQINSRETDNNAANAGAAYVFRFKSAFWSQQAYIKPFNSGSNDEFGQSVSLSNDGNMLVVGANQEDGSSAGVKGTDNNSLAGSGAAYVFEFSNGNWVQQSYVKAYYPANSGHFGYSVSLSGDGGTLAVGASDTRSLSGEAYLY